MATIAQFLASAVVVAKPKSKIGGWYEINPKNCVAQYLSRKIAQFLSAAYWLPKLQPLV
jgi:hypothetical protein